MKRNTINGWSATATVAALGVALFPMPARAHGEDQTNRGFAGAGGSLLVPLSDELDNMADPSPGITLLEAGYIFGFDKGFVVAPTGTVKYFDLVTDDPCLNCDLVADTWQLMAGAKLGFHRKGLLAYGQADIGINFLRWQLVTVVGTIEADESDFMMRFGGGVDYAVHEHIAVGGYAGVPVVLTDNDDGYTENAVGLEIMIYGKFLFP